MIWPLVSTVRSVRFGHSGISTHFKLEGILAAVDLLAENDFMVKLDIKDAIYRHSYEPERQEFLEVSMTKPVLPVPSSPSGLGSVPQAKLLKLVMGLLSRSEIRCVIFVDDLLLLNQDSQALKTQLELAIALLENLWFLNNWKKSVVVLAQKLDYLGFLFDFVSMKLYIPKGNLTDLQQECQKLLKSGSTSARRLAKIIGKISDQCLVRRAILSMPLQFRHLQRLKIKRHHISAIRVMKQWSIWILNTKDNWCGGPIKQSRGTTYQL